MEPAIFAERHGASDVFVLTRIAADRWAHIGGYGHGQAWAGVVELGTVEEPLLAIALTQDEAVCGVSSAPQRVVGPYYARQYAFVPVGRCGMVVAGQLELTPQLSQDRSSLGVDARELVAGTSAVSPAKRLADEMEVLHAMQDMYQIDAVGIRATLDAVAAIAGSALSCAAAAVVTAGGLVAVRTNGTGLPDDKGLVRATVLALLADLTGETLCVQDARDRPIPGPVPAESVCSYFVVRVAEPVGGALLMVHARHEDRGFTELCQQLGAQLGAAASTVVHAATLREQLQGQVELATRAARQDSLTGLGNRLCWESVVLAAQRRADGGERVGVLVLDLNYLKETNDSFGHAVGDELLRRMARCVRSAVRVGDEVCRVGGDEIYALLGAADAETCQDVADRVLDAVRMETLAARPALSVALGRASVPPGGSVEQAVRRADVAMYEHKRSQHAQDARRSQSV